MGFKSMPAILSVLLLFRMMRNPEDVECLAGIGVFRRFYDCTARLRFHEGES